MRKRQSRGGTASFRPLSLTGQGVILMKGKIQLAKVSQEEAEQLWRMQRLAFLELLARYQDRETNPACETLERVRERWNSQTLSFTG